MALRCYCIRFDVIVANDVRDHVMMMMFYFCYSFIFHAFSAGLGPTLCVACETRHVAYTLYERERLVLPYLSRRP